MRDLPPSMKTDTFMPFSTSCSMYSLTRAGKSASSPKERLTKNAPHLCNICPTTGTSRLSPATTCGSARPRRTKIHWSVR